MGAEQFPRSVWDSAGSLMKLLLDNCVPRKFATLIEEHEVSRARDMGWRELQNGKLLQSAELAGFDALLTTDKNLMYQPVREKH